MSDSLVREFVFEKTTKNTTRFQEVTDEERPTIGSLYILQKDLDELEGAPHEKLKVTIEPA